jgi:hypothetical protein
MRSLPRRISILKAAVGALALACALAVALPVATAGAAGHKTVRCIGNGYFCGATVSIAGGASNRVVTVRLTDTDFRRIGVLVIPRESRGAFDISHARFLLGGSEYRFTLNAVRANPRSARIILLFAAAGAVRG